ncbi:DUF6415 family natural product biosynthesis protein [Streptantibioticus ferralitis]|uniref:DUF6415 family natural product biosynthesis protein n=1 Tax=Streptantibioticus ferralitis TaxID=236510 RepID=UPI003CD07E22
MGHSGLDVDRIQEAIWNARFRVSQPSGFQTRGLTAALVGHLQTLLAYAAVRQADLEGDEAASSVAMETITRAQAALRGSRSGCIDHMRLADATAALIKLLGTGQ